MTYRNILIVDDEEFIRLNLKRVYSEEPYRVFLESSGVSALKTAEEEEIDLALLDLNLPDMNGLDILKELKKIKPGILVIIITGYASVESAVEALKLGAYDYIKKPFKEDAIRVITRLALETQSLKEQVKGLRKLQPATGVENILGKSKAISKVRHQIREFSKYDSETVLITGESGSGKELAARALHNLSPRAENDFIEINCASIPETLLESELFGYEKGAFTDAKANKTGLLQLADGGTLFLDEIGEMSLGLQAKLLRVIENKKIRRLGATKDREVDVRVIAATNKNLQSAIAAKEFRKDLYYRINVLRISLPPLRERGEDVFVFTDYFIKHFNRKFNKSIQGFSDKSRAILLQYNWPGNVRELKNIVERICILQKEPLIDVKHLPAELVSDSAATSFNICDEMFETQNLSLEDVLQKTEFILVNRALTVSGGNISKAARLLQLPRETLRYKLSRLKSESGEF